MTTPGFTAEESCYPAARSYPRVGHTNARSSGRRVIPAEDRRLELGGPTCRELRARCAAGDVWACYLYVLQCYIGHEQPQGPGRLVYLKS